ncbi:hypothetical protein GQ42DRAFT_162841 [Ramicandelaber brevisporus]|nr:hypothetical protein GQ42DRAFT_162841 [Ramicandelaber brevisporus]
MAGVPTAPGAALSASASSGGGGGGGGGGGVSSTGSVTPRPEGTLMFDAFAAIPVAERLPLRITCMCTHGDRLYVGTATGVLLIYELRDGRSTANDSSSMELVESRKGFVKKSVDQLGVIKEAGILVALSDGLVGLYDLHSLVLQAHLTTASGAVAFALITEVSFGSKSGTGDDTLSEKSPTPASPSRQSTALPVIVTKLAVATKWKIHIFEWRDAEYVSVSTFDVAERIRSLTWASLNSLFMTTARDTFLRMSLPAGTVSDVDFSSVTSNIAGSTDSQSVRNDTTGKSGSVSSIPVASTPSSPSTSAAAVSTDASAAPGGSSGGSSPATTSLYGRTLRSGALGAGWSAMTQIGSLGASLVGSAVGAAASVASVGGTSSTDKTAMVRLPHNEIMLCTASHGAVIFGEDGKRSAFASNSVSQQYPPVTWPASSPSATSSPPVAWSYTSPFILALSPIFGMDIFHVGLNYHIQQLFELTEASLFTTVGGSGREKRMFAASPTTIWRIVEYPYYHQLAQLIGLERYEEVLRLLDMTGDFGLSIDNDTRRIIKEKVKYLHARALFKTRTRRGCERAIEIFAELGISPTEIIGLLPRHISGDLCEEDDGDDDDTKEIDTASESVNDDVASIVPGNTDDDKASIRSTSSTKPERQSSKVADSPRLQSAPPPTTTTTTAATTPPASAQATLNVTKLVYQDQISALARYLTDQRRIVNRTLANREPTMMFVVRQFVEPDASDEEEEEEDGEVEGGSGNNGGGGGGGGANSSRQSSLNATPLSTAQSPDARAASTRSQRSTEYALGTAEVTAEDFMGFRMSRVAIPTLAIAHLVDTTLLRCYLVQNQALVGPLVRVNNYCDVEVAEELLLLHGKNRELLDLYNNKGLHRKALQLLQRLAQGSTSQQESASTEAFRGVHPTIRYLQRLGITNFDLILEFLRGPLEIDPEEAIKVFIDDRPDTALFPRDRVLAYLSGFGDLRLCISYLVFIVDELDDVSERMHNRLIRTMVEVVEQDLRTGNPMASSFHVNVSMMDVFTKPMINGMNEPQPITSTSASQMTPSTSASAVRAELLVRLERDTVYKPETILTILPDDCMFEERTVVLGRLGLHEQALNTIVHRLGNTSLADMYCEKYLNNKPDIYMLLLRTYLSSSATAMSERSASPQPFRVGSLPSGMSSAIGLQALSTDTLMRHALMLLSRHDVELNALDALNLLPEDTPVTETIRFFENILRSRTLEDRHTTIVQNLYTTVAAKTTATLVTHRKQWIAVTDERMCPHCMKRIGNSACAVDMGSRTVMHYTCYQRVRAAAASAAAASAVSVAVNAVSAVNATLS